MGPDSKKRRNGLKRNPKSLKFYIDIPSQGTNEFQPLFISAMSRLPQKITSGRIQGKFKRLVDIVGAMLGICLLSGPLLAIAVLIRLTSRGPAIFTQNRVAKGGKIFRIYKFRTMYHESEARLEELQGFNETSGPAFKMKQDPRVTPLGRVLRKYSLDELPQLWNIIKGEMSLVGPRPALIAETKDWPPEYYRRLSVHQGLTCIWQISGRSDLSFEKWVEMDIRYVDTWSLGLDLKLILKTFLVVGKGQGAY